MFTTGKTRIFLEVGFFVSFLLFAFLANADQMDADNECVAEKFGYPVDYGLTCNQPRYDANWNIIAIGGQGCECQDRDAKLVGKCIALFKCHGDMCNGKPCELTKPESGTPSPSLGDIEFPPPPTGGETPTAGYPPVSNEFIQDAFGQSSPPNPTPDIDVDPQSPFDLAGGFPTGGTPPPDTPGPSWDDYVDLSKTVQLMPPEPQNMSDFIDEQQSRVLQLPEEAYNTGVEVFPPEEAAPQSDVVGGSDADSWWSPHDAVPYLEQRAVRDIVAVETHYTPGAGGIEGDFTTSQPNYLRWVNASGDPVPTTLDDVRLAHGEYIPVTLASAPENYGQFIRLGPVTYTSPIDGETYTGDEALADSGKAIYSDNLKDVYGYVHDTGDAFTASGCGKYGTCGVRLSKYDVPDGDFTGWSVKDASRFAATQPQQGLQSWSRVSSLPDQPSAEVASFSGFSPRTLFSGSFTPWVGSIAPYLAQVDMMSSPTPITLAGLR